MSDLGERIRQVRGDMSQQAFADMLEISRKTISRYESGSHSPDAEFIIRLNVIYGVQPLWLLTGKGPDTAGERLSPREARLLAVFRTADDQGKAALEAMAAALPTTASPSKKTSTKKNK